MSDFIAFDDFYRYNCEKNLSQNSDRFFLKNDIKSSVFFLPYGKYSQCANLLSDSYDMLNVDSGVVIFLVPTFNYFYDSFMFFNKSFLYQLNEIINIDFELLDKVQEVLGNLEFCFDFEYEEILKIHIDFLREKYPKVKILPIFYNKLMNGVLSKFLDIVYNNFSIVFLTNMSLGFNYSEAQKNNLLMAYNIENNLVKNYSIEDFSCYHILNEILQYFENKKCSFVRLGILNSGDYSFNLASTKSFGAWMLYAGGVVKLFQDYYKHEIFDFIRFNLEQILHIGTERCFEFPQFFNQNFRLFVCVEKNDFVRGVSGSYKTPEPFYKAVVKRVFGAAFSDKRFSPIQPAEIDDLKFTLSFVPVNGDIFNSFSIEF